MHSRLKVGQTIIVAVIQTWKDELQRHLKSTDDLSVRIYYGKDRTKYLRELHHQDLVITTYSVVRLDWKASITQPENRSTLYGIKWSRIVLDEGIILTHIVPGQAADFFHSAHYSRAY